MILRRISLPRLVAVAMGGGGVVPFVGAYDDIPGIVHAYEAARRVFTDYDEELLGLRRVSDDAERFFGGSPSTGELEKAEIATWLGGSTGECVWLADQTGGDHLTQAAHASQPLFTASVKNGHAGLVWDGLADFLQGAFTVGGQLSQPYSIYAVAQLDASSVNDGANHFIFDGDDTTSRAVAFARGLPGTDVWSIYSASGLLGGATDANWNIWSAVFDGLSSEFWLNGISDAAGQVITNNPDGLTLGARFTGTQEFWKGPICSIVIVDPAHTTAQREAMQDAMNNYWGAY